MVVVAVIVVVVVVVVAVIVMVVVVVVVRSMRPVIVLHQTSGSPSQCKPQQQGDRQGDPIMPMELQLRKQIAQGDAEDHAGGECDGRRLHRGSPAEPGPTDHRSGGGHQGVGNVHPVAHRTRTTIGREQRAQRQGIERLVQGNRQQQTHPCNPEAILQAGGGGPEGQPREQTVNAQTDQSPEPRRRMRMRTGIALVRS